MDISNIIIPRHTAILLIDLQRDFLSIDGVLGKAGQDIGKMRQVIEPIRTLLSSARPLKIPIIFTQYVDRYQYRNAPGKHMFEKKELSEERLCCREGSIGVQFSDIIPQKNDSVIIKHSYDAFDGTTLEEILRNHKRKTLIVSGVKTNACVETTVRTAYHKGFYVVVPRECVASNTDREHEATLFNVDRYFGDVVSLTSLLHNWS